jgi:hypothetical protein
MKNYCTSLHRLIAAVALILVSGSLAWLHTVAPAAAQSPVELNLQITTEAGAAATDLPPTFNVGETFKVSIVAQGVNEPGIFGGQFDLLYDTTHLQALEGSLLPAAMLEPVIVVRSTIDPVEGRASFAASRRGEVDELTGNVTLATISFKAIAATEPPEGQTTVITLENVKLGAKGGLPVDVSGLLDLEIIIKEENAGPDATELSGVVRGEGRAAGNQAGHQIIAAGDLGATFTAATAADGSFLFEEVPADVYTLTASSPGFLSAVCTGALHTAETPAVLLEVTLLAGDLDNSGEIDITDAVAIGAAFGSADPANVANLNRDDVVDVLDLILLAANFGQTSVDNPWLCQLPQEI